MNDASDRPRRRIEQRHPTTGQVIGVFETTLSDAELAERDRAAAERRARMLAQSLSVTAEARRHEQVEREALAGIGVNVDARDHLRTAHQALAQARDDLARRLEVAAAAGRHVDACQASYHAAKSERDALDCRAAAMIVEQLQKGEPPAGQASTRAAAEQAEAARIDLEHATAARNEIDGLLGAAERTVTEAEASVKAAAREVIKLRVSKLRGEINQLTEQLEERRDRLNELLPTLSERRWPTPWPDKAVALLHDAEANLDDGVPPETSAAA